MIRSTFQILDHIGQKTEQSIWDQGIPTWNNFLETERVQGISPNKKLHFDRKLLAARRALYEGNSSYFVPILKSTQQWRLFDFFKEDAVYLDIETDGLGSYADITVIGLYDGIQTKSMIKGINLDYNQLKQTLKQYKLIVTFNGASFDLPFIRKRYDILPNVPHIDLRHCCAQLNLTGGLKQIEKSFNIKRRDLVENMYGGDALTLWRMYKASGDRHYLNLLVEYNEEDIINLKKIMEYSYAQLKQKINKIPNKK